MKLSIDHLPASIRQLADEIGLAAALALVLHFGGKELWPARSGPQAQRLKEIMGAHAAQRFTEIYREPYRVPLCRRAAVAVAQDAIRAEFDRLTRLGLSARAAVAQLANQPPLYHTDRHIWRLLKMPDGAVEIANPNQRDLF